MSNDQPPLIGEPVELDPDDANDPVAIAAKVLAAETERALKRSTPDDGPV